MTRLIVAFAAAALATTSTAYAENVTPGGVHGNNDSITVVRTDGSSIGVDGQVIGPGQHYNNGRITGNEKGKGSATVHIGK